ncbi:MAG: alpha/beta fold hydrolase, partial [Candidatus Binatia bacterium]
MATFLLVHGAWHGAWCWRRVASRLRAAGHEVFTPTLTGLGERLHLLTRDTDLGTHVDDVLGALVAEELADVILVGHSYGGMVISGVAQRAPERLKHLVYLDAFVPKDGASLEDLVPPAIFADLRKATDADGDGFRVPPFPVQAFGVTGPEEDVAWIGRRLVFQPLKTMTQKVRVTNPAAAKLPRTYV